MRIRIKTQWSKQEREVSVEDAVSVLAFNAWKIGMQTLLEIENENFQVDTQLQRMDVIEEIMTFIIHCTDRMVYTTIENEGRSQLITLYAKKIADHVQDNKRDFAGAGDYRSPFIEKLNLRMADYAETRWNDDLIEPGFGMGRLFGNYVADTLGSRDQQWALDYIQQVLLPDMMTTYKRAVRQVGLIEEKPES